MEIIIRVKNVCCCLVKQQQQTYTVARLQPFFAEKVWNLINTVPLKINLWEICTIAKLRLFKILTQGAKQVIHVDMWFLA